MAAWRALKFKITAATSKMSPILRGGSGIRSMAESLGAYRKRGIPELATGTEERRGASSRLRRQKARWHYVFRSSSYARRWLRHPGFALKDVYRGPGSPAYCVAELIERLRQHNEERRMSPTGLILGDPSRSHIVSEIKYAETFPQNFRFLFRGGYPAEFLAPDIIAQAGINAWERLASRCAGAITWPASYGLTRTCDLTALQTGTMRSDTGQGPRGLDWTLLWPPEQSLHQLQILRRAPWCSSARDAFRDWRIIICSRCKGEKL